MANHNKAGPKTKVKMKTFLKALSSVLYEMVYFPPHVLYGKHLYISKSEQGTRHSDRKAESFSHLRVVRAPPSQDIQDRGVNLQIYRPTTTPILQSSRVLLDTPILAGLAAVHDWSGVAR